MSKKQKVYDVNVKTSIGGQALIEGIMMRGPKRTAMAVRNTSGEIVIEEWKTEFSAKKKVLKMPVIRGVFAFFDSMKIGYKCLMRSAEISGLEEIEEDLKREKAAKKAAKQGIVLQNISDEKLVDIKNTETEIQSDTENIVENKSQSTIDDKSEKETKKSGTLTTLIMIIGIVFGVVLAIGLFKFVPELLYQYGFLKLFPSLDNAGYGYSFARALFTGIVKISLLVGYMLLISLMKDIRRTFMFHGAEHKTIFCYEHGLPLTVENIKIQRRFHPRCGTSFLILMMIVGIFITMFIPQQLVSSPIYNTILRTFISLLLLPLMMGLGYELIKVAGKHDNIATRIISAPGMWLQHITTKEPDNDMIECAIAAVIRVIPDDGSDILK